MLRRQSDAKNRLIEKIIAKAIQMVSDDIPFNVSDYIRQFYRNVSVEDLRERDFTDLAGAALSQLNLASHRKPGKPNLRIYNPTRKTNGWTSTHTIVEVVNNDMPFLVDSIGMVLIRFGLSIYLTIHPIIQVKRSKRGKIQEVLPKDSKADDVISESFLHFEIDRQTDPMVIRNIETAISKTLKDVRAAVDDWRTMRQKAHDVCKEIENASLPLSDEVISEGTALLRWLADDHFTFLGYREYKLIKGQDEDRLEPVDNTGLGILHDEPAPTGKKTATLLSKEIRRQARSKDLLVITKANSLATVHRDSYLDYIGVKQFEGGKVVGEHRFLGLFTSIAYSLSPREIPLLRHKVEQVMEASGLNPVGHGGKALLHILDSFPRDEMFQSSVEDLVRTSVGIFNLQERQRIKLFIRRDAFRRFFSCLVYVPRDKYNTQIRLRIENILKDAFEGHSVESNVQLSESNLARVHSIVRTSPGSAPKVSIQSVEKQLVEAVRSWADVLREILIERFGEERGIKLYNGYGHVFPTAYTEDVTPREATFDIERMATLTDDSNLLRMSLYRPPSYPENNLRFKLFHTGEPIPISDVLPMLENMGLQVIGERPYRVPVGDAALIWIQDFEMVYGTEALDPAAVNQIFQETFANTWHNLAENDGFNKLVLSARMDWRAVAMFRAYCRYLLQTGLPFSQQYMEQVLCDNREICALLLDLFSSRFDPTIGPRKRARDYERLIAKTESALDRVASLDEDRILRAYLSLIQATLRTNFYQSSSTGESKSYISFKFDPLRVPDLPLPRPMFEIFVYSPRVEGVHLRGGKVARGGLRWSDRREDFRTEVLGLMKAQNVKNTLIVPMGAKGGFVAKQLPASDREKIQAEVIECYKIFIHGLLDLTDNIVDDKIITPDDVVRQDQDDSYLVVAADKGTATFSDIANEISEGYGFWLGDAFASGGSAGYDHKKMGITARGAWEAVKRHFREIGVDVQNHDFTVAGIGDMSGDVFGNGMLQSRHTKLVAAFNHMHIFLDPDPDPDASYTERERLFNLPRSTWEDYSAKLISKGGGVWSRQEKSISLGAEARQLLGVEEKSLPPQEVIRAILRMEVDLLWNGGIGTYVKSSNEVDAEAGDRTNDGVRIDALELRCKVVGEGGNLGFTQHGRVEYSLNDGRINTDFIDNSAGVDTSDREVNIKILLGLVAKTKPLTTSRRNKLLTAMTDEVAGLVLQNNYLQTQAISMLESHALERVNAHTYMMHALERSGELDRDLEFLPSDEEILERRKQGKGFTRPELSVILSYSKISLYNKLIFSDVPEDPFLATELQRYFPQPLQRRYRDLMPEHPLAREIIATAVTNSMINRMGPVFALRIEEDSGADIAAIARAYTISREVLNVRKLWHAIEELDNDVHANVQYSMMFQTTRLLKHATTWFLSRHGDNLNIDEIVSRLKPDVSKVRKDLHRRLVGGERERFDEAVHLYEDIGVPTPVARKMAGLNTMYAVLDIVEVAQEHNRDVQMVAGLYFQVGHGLKLDWIRDQIEILQVEGRWQAVARGTLRENLYSLHRELTSQLVHITGEEESPGDLVLEWLDDHKAQVSHFMRTMQDMRAAGAMDFPTLSVALQEIRKLTLK